MAKTKKVGQQFFLLIFCCCCWIRDQGWIKRSYHPVSPTPLKIHQKLNDSLIWSCAVITSDFFTAQILQEWWRVPTVPCSVLAWLSPGYISDSTRWVFGPFRAFVRTCPLTAPISTQLLPGHPSSSALFKPIQSLKILSCSRSGLWDPDPVYM